MDISTRFSVTFYNRLEAVGVYSHHYVLGANFISFVEVPSPVPGFAASYKGK